MRVFVHTDLDLPERARPTTGAGARPWEMSRALAARGCQVTLAAPNAAAATAPDGVTLCDAGGALPVGHDAYVLAPSFFQGRAPVPAGGLLIADTYDPMLLSYAHRDPDTPDGRLRYQHRIHALLRALLEADVFLHAGPRARPWLTGMLALAGRLGPGHPEPADDLLDVPALAPPLSTRGDGPPLDVSLPGDAEVLLWSSGTYAFFDAERALAAFDALAARRTRLHLLVVGGLNPRPDAADREAFRSFRDRVAGLRHSERVHVVDWLPYARRSAMYDAATLALVLTRPGTEDALAWRNRTVDACWGGVPSVCDGDDALTERLAEVGAVRRVDRTVEATTAALGELLEDPDALTRMRRACADVAEGELSWARGAERLTRRIAKGRPGALMTPPGTPLRLDPPFWGTMLHRARVSLALRGPAGFAWHHLRRLAGGGAPPTE